MNDFSNIPLSDSPAHQSDDNRLTAECYDEFLEALDILYIKGNLSGRLKFLEAWPLAGQLLFGDELIGFDREGTSDMERRNALEEEAEERRLEMLESVQTLEEKSVEKSVLQVEYVEALVKKLGRDLALLLYAPKIVDRFIPPPSEPIVSEAVDAGADSSQASVAVPNDPLKSEASDVEALASDIIPDAPQAGAPSAANPIVDVPELPKNPAPQNPEEAAKTNNIPDPFAETKAASRKPVVPEIDDSMDAVEPISVEPPPQRPVPEDIQEEAAQQNLETPAESPQAPPPEAVSSEATPREPTRPPLPAEPTRPPLPEADGGDENVFLGRDPYAPPEPPPPAQQEHPAQQQAAAPSDPVQQDVSKPAMHKALDGAEPIASQKMTFMPAKKPAEQEKPSVPVIGGDTDKPSE